MGRPLLFIDFDGVINQFPDPKVMRRQGTTDWMRPDDPRRAAYAPDNWFRPDRRERLLVHDLGRRFTIRWNAELVARLDALDADNVFCQVGVGRFGVSFSPCERRVSGRFGVGRSCWLLVIALVIA